LLPGFRQELRQGVHGVEVGRGRFSQSGQLDDGSKQCIDLERTPRLDILKHGSLVVADLLRTGNALLERNAEADAELVGDRLRLGHHGRRERTTGRVLADPRECCS